MIHSTTRDRASAALWLIFAGDALSMPVHWYYNQQDIKRTYDYIREYHPAPDYHPSSIMNLHSTGSGGRGEQGGSIVGDVILKGKKHLWGKSNTHYHHGMQAGENTLNALCARLLMRTITSNKGKYDADTFLNNYVEFMTTEGSHNDTYAESYHRFFFSNYINGKPLRKCAAHGHDTPSIGGFVSLPIVVIASLKDGKEEMQKRVKEHLFLTHPDEDLASFAQIYCNTLHDLLRGSDPKERLLKTAKEIGVDVVKVTEKSKQVGDNMIVSNFGLACYITSSMPNIVYLSWKYSNNPEEALLANTNAGGENCHRGSALGALVGAANGMSKIPKWMTDNLKEKNSLEKEIEQFLNVLEV